MRKSLLLLGFAALTAPAATAQFINEFHYNDVGADANEFVEVALPEGANPADYSVVLYNGAATSRAPYSTAVVSNCTQGATAGGRTLYSCYASDASGNTGSQDFSPATAIQNGDPDGIALVNTTTSTVEEFISYGGTFIAASGPASGQTSTDVGFIESGSADGTSIGRVGADGIVEAFALSPTATPGALNTGQVSLPVELVAFTGAASGTSARLAWTTASETNNHGFFVEQQTGSAWVTVSGLIAGRGTTTERSDYTHSVNGLTAGRHTFRLRQIDADGTVHYSPTATVEIGIEGEGRVTLLGQRAVRIETNASQAVRVSVYDVLGRAVLAQAVAVDGTGVVELPVLASGSYVVRVEGERFAQTRTLVVR